jgi:uncharacterized protein YqjF (DUF2071 family)
MVPSLGVVLGACARLRWRRVVLAHWVVEAGPLERALPTGVTLDLHEGRAWTSVVACEVVGPLPDLLLDSGLEALFSHRQVGLRTYVQGPLGPGTVILDTAVDRVHALYPRLGGLPYRLDRDLTSTFRGERLEVRRSGEALLGEVGPGRPEPVAEGTLDAFLLQRPWLYARSAALGSYGARLAHAPLRVLPAQVGSTLHGRADLAHVIPYVDGVRVEEAVRLSAATPRRRRLRRPTAVRPEVAAPVEVVAAPAPAAEAPVAAGVILALPVGPEAAARVAA